jgi:uncharacterized BrkB/YihY/UPF0761 family membrane protein
MHTTLRERYERQARVRWYVRVVGQVAGYGLAGTSITLMVWLFLVGLL